MGSRREIHAKYQQEREETNQWTDDNYDSNIDNDNDDNKNSL